ncbi:MAG: hypothetical protein AAF402_12340 [Pseudomonadota bacterium]
MKKDNTSTGRRKLLKLAGITGAGTIASTQVPDVWHSPVIDSVVLPSHAATSPTPPAPSIPPASGPSPFAGTYAVTLDNPGVFNGNCSDSSTVVPGTATVVVNSDATFELFERTYVGVVPENGLFDVSVTLSVFTNDEGDCTIVDRVSGQIFEGVATATLTSTQTCTSGCEIVVTSGLTGIRIGDA